MYASCALFESPQSEPLHNIITRFSKISPVPPISDMEPVMVIDQMFRLTLLLLVDVESNDISRSAHT